MENLLSGMEWGEDKISRLIDLYREQPVLWDQTLAEYKDKNRKNYAWNDISRELKLSKAEVQSKIRGLIYQFNRESKKGKSGSGAEEAKIKWRYYNSFLFLKDKSLPRETRATQGEQEPDQENAPGIEEAEGSIAAPSTHTPDTVSPSTSRPITARYISRSTKRKHNPQEEAYDVMKKLQSNIKEKDEYDVFGENVAFQIRRLSSERNKALAKHRINQILFEIEMLDIDTRDTGAPSRSSSGLSLPQNSESSGGNSVSLLQPYTFNDTEVDNTIDDFDLYNKCFVKEKNFTPLK